MLTVSEIHSLLYGFEETCDAKLSSVHPEDHPIFRVKIVPYLIGSALRNADPEERYFHIEFFPPDKAEIWESKAWNDSLTRRLRLAGIVQTYYQTPEESSRAKMERALISHFKSCHLAFRHARALTEMLISGPENLTVLQLAGLPEQLAHELQLYRNTLDAPRP
jgi:hypothetical protein